jgi:hypothetical protein
VKDGVDAMVAVSNLEAAAQLPSLLDIVGARSVDTASATWWGPVIGSDEFQPDGITDSFSMGPCLAQDEQPGPSDRRLKDDITGIGTTVYGLPLYRFRYRDREGLYEGVMADDVLRVKPSAVSYGEDGFLRVNYRSLGLEMRRVA